MANLNQFTVTSATRLDKFLVDVLDKTYSRSQLQKHIAAGRVRLNGEIVTEPSKTILEGTQVSYLAPDPDPEFPAAASANLTILHEDSAIMVIDKPAGMTVHPNTFAETGTLVHALLALRPEIKDALYDPENPISRMRPGIVHRLDKDTSGIIVVAKTREALLNLVEQFRDRHPSKKYQTLLYGSLKEPRTIDAVIVRKGGGNKNRMGASHTRQDGREAVSHFTPLQILNPYPKWPTEFATLTEVSIETGRTHQIRVHAKFMGHPVLGDTLYTNKPATRLSERLGLTHQLLRAVSLQIIHPTTGEPITFTTSDLTLPEL